MGGFIDCAIVVAAVIGALPKLLLDNGDARLPRFRWTAHVVSAFAIAMVTYMTLIAVFRPLTTQWGSTDVDRATTLAGDSLTPNARYRIEHAITIHAAAASVWPWLAQIGQNRAGFYSYSWLERLFGDEIRNADHIHALWQKLDVGDLVLAVQPGYLGGIFGD